MSRRPLHTLALPPATLSALTRAGYETVRDITSATPEQVAADARLPLNASQAVFSATQTQNKMASLTQSAAAMAQSTSTKYCTGCAPIDAILDDGLKKGFVLEVSGPPGSCKESVALGMARTFLDDNQDVLFVDMQNMTTASQVLDFVTKSASSSSSTRRYADMVFHTTLHTISDLMVFLHKLPWYLKEHPRLGLLVLNSLWYPFQSTAGLSYSARSAVLDRTRETLAQACATTGLSVIITTQLSTKLLNADGSPATFDTGARAVMVPQPTHTYLPPGRSHRVMIVPRTRTAGVVRLISSPTHPYEPGQPAHREEPYEMVRGCVLHGPRAAS
ncbi:hypothetical protein PsYK624_109810 [Phanerochaete sordida]|uniref:P-loop containing nucleoside triphosphate hydrolase protein n=1 Tax=Phanerochaete sordida TaxID=48140 RepID=A0A9P3GFP2_9APHY|nr:hypothetical protein PsYK624_109810 [Phanerochaete sordida]